MKIGLNQVMEVSNMTSRFDNHDFDGDSLIALALHSEQARGDFKFAFTRNIVEFDHMDELLIDFEHETIYSSYMLTLKAFENPVRLNSKKSLFDKIDIHTLMSPKYGGETYEVEEYKFELNEVERAINRILGGPLLKHGINQPIYIIERDGFLDKKNLYALIESYWKLIRNFPDINFWDVAHELDKFFLECSGSLSHCIPSFELADFVVDDPEIDEYKENLLTEEPFLAFHQNMILFEKVASKISEDPENILNKVFKSGARLKSVQLLKAASNTGIPTDIYGKAFPANIKNSLLDGLTQKDYFITGDSARLALAVRQEAIPKGGELQRKFFFSTGILKLDKNLDDCQADISPSEKRAYKIKILSWKHLKLLNHRYFIIGDKEYHIDLDSATEEDISFFRSLIGQEVKFLSPVTCQHKNYRICKKCFGSKLPESINLGSIVGAAISEGIIQSVLRAHHFGGAFIATEDKKVLEILKKNKILGHNKILFKNETAEYKEDVKYIQNYLANIYDENDIKLTTENTPDGILMTIEVINLPFNDDSVKQLNSIVSLIDKNRNTSIIPPETIYEKLELVIEQNNILSVYMELIISLLYYDEDGVLLRYSEKEPVKQIALKNIIEMLDPKLSIFYNFSNKMISKIYNHKGVGEVGHMYHDLLDIYS